MWISGESGVCGSVHESGVCGLVHESGVCGSVVRVVCVDQW